MHRSARYERKSTRTESLDGGSQSEPSCKVGGTQSLTRLCCLCVGALRLFVVSCWLWHCRFLVLAMVACSHHLFLRILPLHPPSSYFLLLLQSSSVFSPPLFRLCFLLVSCISRLQISSSFLGDSFEVACRTCVELLVLSDLCCNKLCAKMLWLYLHCIWLLIVDRRLLLFRWGASPSVFR